MHYILLVFPFLILVGIAAGYATVFRLNLAEGMVPAVCSIVLVLFCSVIIFHTMIVGIFILFLLAVAGVYLTVASCILEKDFRIRYINTPYFVMLVCILILSLMIFAGTTISRVQELRLWALAPKYLLSYNKLYSSSHEKWTQGVVLFEAFFLKFAGYTEGTLYAVNALLCWIGLLLPFGQSVRFDHDRESSTILTKEEIRRILSEWGRIVLYAVVLYAALYSVYMYGAKTCSPELPLACFAGGLAGWLTTGKRKKTDILVLVSGFLTIWMFRTSGGGAFILLIIMLILFNVVFMGKGEEAQQDQYFFASLIGLVIIIGVMIIAGLMHFVGSNAGIARQMWPEFCQSVVECNLTQGISDLNYTFLFGLFLLIALLLVNGIWTGSKKQAIVYAGYLLVSGACYLIALFGNHFSGDVLTKEDGKEILIRAVSMLAIYMLVLVISWIAHTLYIKRPRYFAGAFVALLLIFLYGWNTDFLARSTAIKPESVEENLLVQKVKKEAEALVNDKESFGSIYMINQGDELASAAALYYMGKRVNDYSKVVWQYNPDGGKIYDQVDPYKGISNLPKALAKGKYRYVWVLQSDEYLETALPTIMGEEIISETNKDGKGNESASEEGSGSAKKTSSDADNDKKKTSSETESTGKKTGEDSKTSDNEERLVNEESLTGGQLYKVIYKKGKPYKLQFVKTVLPYDNREEYYRWSE